MWQIRKAVSRTHLGSTGFPRVSPHAFDLRLLRASVKGSGFWVLLGICARWWLGGGGEMRGKWWGLIRDSTACRPYLYWCAHGRGI